MTLKQTISEDMKNAMRARESQRLGTIRMLQAAIRQREIDDGHIELGDEEVVVIVDKLIKQRRDSIAAFTQAQRQDLADQEQAEIEVLQAYLPARLSEAEIAQAVGRIVKSLGASGPGDMGKVMGQAKKELAGKADMAEVSRQVKAALAA